MRRGNGFSLVEVVVGLTVMALGVLPAVAAVAVAERAGWQGRARAAMSLQVLLLADSLRTAAGAGLPGCAALAGGRLEPWPDGLVEWVGSSRAGLPNLYQIRITAERRRPGLVLADTTLLLVRCT